MNVELMPRTRSHDVSGFGVFSQGDAGQAHVAAHRMLDEGRHELGHRLLGAWLEGRSGSGSDWTHLQWHMAVFELAVGQWDAAFARLAAAAPKVSRLGGSHAQNQLFEQIAAHCWEKTQRITLAAA